MAVTVALIRAIIAAERPSGWGVRESRRRAQGGLSAEAYISDEQHRAIVLPKISKRADVHHILFMFFHEVGHIRMGHVSNPPVPEPDINHVGEYKAERFAMEKMREYGVPVRPKDLSLAKWRVRQHIKADEKKGIRIAPHVRRWSRERRTET